MSRLAAAPLLALALAACAVPEWQKPGTPLADIERTMGRPTLAEPLESGGQRLVYSRQPAGQQVYHMDFDASQRLVRVTQVLTLENFQALRNGLERKTACAAGSARRRCWSGWPALTAPSGPTAFWTMARRARPMCTSTRRAWCVA